MSRLSHCAFGKTWILALGVALGIAASALAQNPTPPPEPDVTPEIARTYSNDQSPVPPDGIDDDLRARYDAAQGDPQQLAQLVDVELIFIKQITQEQIDAFAALGGVFDHIFTNVSYGWNGRIPLGKLLDLKTAMGTDLVLIDAPKTIVQHMDIATQSGRVRPIWSNFAGQANGFDGDPSISIAIIDTGLDASHTDLSGRQQFWKDYTPDAFASAQDLLQHGSHVAGVALGTGLAGGSATSTLKYTDSGDMTSVPAGSLLISPIGLPNAALNFSATAKWAGGGSTDLYLLYHSKGIDIFSVLNAVSASTFGSTGITEANNLTPTIGNAYMAGLLQNDPPTIGKYLISNTVTNYPGVGDGFPKFRGVAPACKWAGAKVFTNAGTCFSSYVNAAIDDMVALRVTNNIKVMNLSLGASGSPGLNGAERQKVNTAVKNGIVLTVSAGNDGELGSDDERTIDDPGRAALALTVAASNDVNQLTTYTSSGFSSPINSVGQEEDYKPDLMAPGGSARFYTNIMSVDSNTGDTSAFADQNPNDYYNIQGTSMSSPFAAGCAALVIDAMQKAGTSWDFLSGQHARYVKMLLCATATESNAAREGNSNNPTLQRAANGPNGYPAGKDPYEGFGMINPDAAVEAVALNFVVGSSEGGSLGSGFADRRAWARQVYLDDNEMHTLELLVPAGGDFDLYLYSATTSNYGTPVLLASSTNAGSDTDESINYVPPTSGLGIIVVKRVSGSGTFTLNSSGGDQTAPAVADVTASNPDGVYVIGDTIHVQVVFDEPVLVTGTPQLALNTTPARVADYVSGSGSATLVFNYTVQPGDFQADLDYAATDALTLNGGTIKDLSNHDAVLTLPAPGAAHSLGNNKALQIDGSPPGDYDHDGDVDGADLLLFNACFTGPEIPQPGVGCTRMKFDADADVDMIDFGIWQRCVSGSNKPANVNCVN